MEGAGGRSTLAWPPAPSSHAWAPLLEVTCSRGLENPLQLTTQGGEGLGGSGGSRKIQSQEVPSSVPQRRGKALRAPGWALVGALSQAQALRVQLHLPGDFPSRQVSGEAEPWLPLRTRAQASARFSRASDFISLPGWLPTISAPNGQRREDPNACAPWPREGGRSVSFLG